MAKKRKTRRMKHKSDLRHTHELRQEKAISPSPSPKPTITVSNFASSRTTIAAIDTGSYTYLRHDLVKTLSLTGAVVLAQIVLYFLL